MRGFLGMKGGKDSKKSRAKAEMLANIMRGGAIKEDPQEKYKKILQEKLNELMMQAMTGQGKQKPGTIGGKQKQGKELSKTTKKLLEHMAAARIKKQQIAESQKVVIRKKQFTNGGRLEEDGKIYNKKNEMVGMIDYKTGKIKNKFGMDVGKYKDNYSGNWKLTKMIDNSVVVKPSMAPTGSGLGGHSPFDNPYAPTPSDSSGGSGGGMVWSTFSNDDDKGGGWW